MKFFFFSPKRFLNEKEILKFINEITRNQTEIAKTKSSADKIREPFENVTWKLLLMF